MVSDVIPCLDLSSGQKFTGFAHIERLLKDPRLFGYERCLTKPVLQGNTDLSHLHFLSVLSSRAYKKNDSHKLLFLLADDNRDKVVLKCFTDITAANREFSQLQQVQHINHVVKIRCSACVNITVHYVPENGRDDIALECTGFLLEYCRPLAPSEALPMHIAKIGLALRDIASLNIFHNDVSPDNLMISVETGQPVICDFDMASVDQDIVNPLGTFSGKYLFAPCVAYVESEGGFIRRCGSLISDLESLLYTAYSLAHGGANWASTRDRCHINLSLRSRACGYHARRNVMLPVEHTQKWEPFLNGMSAAFGERDFPDSPDTATDNVVAFLEKEDAAAI